MDHDGVSGRRFHWRSVLDVLTSVVMISATVFLVWLHYSARPTGARAAPQIPDEPISIADAASKGGGSASVVMIAFADFQCPYCGRFAREILPQVEAEYIKTGRLQLVYRHLPLPNHQHAVGAAHAAECARRQGRFWPMHDRLFTQGADLDDAGLRAIAESVELDMLQFDACLAQPSTRAPVSRDTAEARALGLSSTPSFLLGSRLPDGRVQVSRVLSGARPVEEFKKELDRLIAPPPPDSLWRRLFSSAAR